MAALLRAHRRWNMRDRLGTVIKRIATPGTPRPLPVTGIQLVNEQQLATCSADGRVSWRRYTSPF